MESSQYSLFNKKIASGHTIIQVVNLNFRKQLDMAWIKTVCGAT